MHSARHRSGHDRRAGRARRAHPQPPARLEARRGGGHCRGAGHGSRTGAAGQGQTQDRQRFDGHLRTRPRIGEGGARARRRQRPGGRTHRKYGTVRRRHRDVPGLPARGTVRRGCGERHCHRRWRCGVCRRLRGGEHRGRWGFARRAPRPGGPEQRPGTCRLWASRGPRGHLRAGRPGGRSGGRWPAGSGIAGALHRHEFRRACGQWGGCDGLAAPPGAHSRRGDRPAAGDRATGWRRRRRGGTADRASRGSFGCPEPGPRAATGPRGGRGGHG